MPALLRAFVAVEIPQSLLTALETVQSELRRRLRARWVRPGSMHLTLKFLGEAVLGFRGQCSARPRTLLPVDGV